MTAAQSVAGLADLYAQLGRELTRPGGRTDTVAAVSRLAVERVPGVEWASITEGRRGRFATIAATDDGAREVDQIQYDLGTGPCVDAILNQVTFRTGDLRNDERWPQFGQRAADRYQVASMLSFRLYLEDDERIAGLNLYSRDKDAFDDDAEVLGTLVATHGALAISAATAREETAQLRQALTNSREIGTAMGVLMATHRLNRDQAFDLLRIASQNTNRKLADIASDVADTGTLQLPGDNSSKRRHTRP